MSTDNTALPDGSSVETDAEGIMFSNINSETYVPDRKQPAPDPTESEAVPADEEIIDPEAPLDPEAEKPASTSSDDELVDWGDGELKGKVSKSLKPYLMRQAAFTKATQETAAERAAVQAWKEAEETALKRRAEYYDTRDATFEHQAEIHRLDKEIAKFENEDWVESARNEPARHVHRMAEYNQLIKARQLADAFLKVEEAKIEQIREENSAKQLDDFNANIHKYVPHWNEERARELTKVATDTWKIPFDRLKTIRDPQVIQIMDLALLGQKVIDKRKALAAKPEPTPATPNAVLRSNSGGAPLAPDPADTAKWIKWYNAQRDKNNS